MTAAVATVAELPSTDDCVCCRNGGVLPMANGTAGVVDLETVRRCCRDCIAGLFLDGLGGWAFLFDANTKTVRFA